LKNTF
jgi:aminomethyltransferase